MTTFPNTPLHSRIYNIRGSNVMLDRDLAELYEVETRTLNQAVKRNGHRFPLKYMFQLNNNEFNNLKSQIVTSSWGGTRKPPFAFTEHGALMAASVLSSFMDAHVVIKRPEDGEGTG